jgi:hypothetical protein
MSVFITKHNWLSRAKIPVCQHAKHSLHVPQLPMVIRLQYKKTAETMPHIPTYVRVLISLWLFLVPGFPIKMYFTDFDSEQVTVGVEIA